MSHTNKRLFLELALAMAVCGVIGLLDRAVIALVGAGVCAAIFAVRFFLSTANRAEATKIEEPLELTGGGGDEHRDPSRCYNPENPALPIYYPTGQRK